MTKENEGEHRNEAKGISSGATGVARAVAALRARAAAIATRAYSYPYPKPDKGPCATRGASEGLVPPDYLDPILAYRSWYMRFPVSLVSLVDDPFTFVPDSYIPNLYSLTRTVTWSPRVPFVAQCRCELENAQYMPSRPLYASWPPGIVHSCGVYAYKEEDVEWKSYLSDNISLNSHQSTVADTLLCVPGRVWLWGNVVEHTFGYRAQYAYPESFIIGDPDTKVIVSFMRSGYAGETTYIRPWALFRRLIVDVAKQYGVRVQQRGDIFSGTKKLLGINGPTG